jgi:hypothetical protein
MLQHCVFCDIRDDADPAAVGDVMRRLGDLVPVVDGMIAFQHGSNRDYEAKSARYSMGFICTFRDRAAHLTYETHPAHQAAGRDLVALCSGGVAGIMVFDLEIG